MNPFKTLEYIDKHIVSKILSLNVNYSVTYFEYFNNHKCLFIKEIENIKDEKLIHSKLFNADFWETVKIISSDNNQLIPNKKIINQIFNTYSLSFKNDKISYSHINSNAQLFFQVLFNYSPEDRTMYLEVENCNDVIYFEKPSNKDFFHQKALLNKNIWIEKNKTFLSPVIGSFFTVTKENMLNLMKEFINCCSAEFLGSEAIQKTLFPIDILSNESCRITEKFKLAKKFHTYEDTAPSFSLHDNIKLLYNFQDLYLTLFLKDFQETNKIFYDFNKDTNIVKLELHPVVAFASPDYFLTVDGNDTNGFLHLYKDKELLFRFSLSLDTKHIIDTIDALIKSDYMNDLFKDEYDLNLYENYMNIYKNAFLEIFKTKRENIVVQYPSVQECFYQTLYTKRFRFELYYKDNIFYYGTHKSVEHIIENKAEIFRKWEEAFLIDKIEQPKSENKNKKRI